MERGEWDEEGEYPRAPLPAHERQWRHPSEQGANAWNLSEPPLVVGRGLSVATGTVGAVLAVGLLWLMVPHSNRGGGGVAEVSSTVHVVGAGGGSTPRQTNLPLSIVSSSTADSTDANTPAGGTTRHTSAPTGDGADGAPTEPSDETTSASDPDESTAQPPASTSPTSANATPTSTVATASTTASSGSTGGTSAPTSPTTRPSTPAASGSTSSVPGSSSTSASPPSVAGSGGIAYAVALTDDHFVATTAAAVGGQDTVNVQLPTGNTVVGNVVSVDPGSGVAVLSVPSDTPTTPIAPSSTSSSTGAVVMTPDPTPVTVVEDSSGKQITYDSATIVREGALVLDGAKHLIGLCTHTVDGVHVVDAQALLDAINGASASEPTAWLGLHVTGADLTVDSLSPGGPAEGAGVQLGDVITAVDGAAVSGLDELTATVQSHHPDETATLTVNRAGTAGPVDIAVVLGANEGSL